MLVYTWIMSGFQPQNGYTQNVTGPQHSAEILGINVVILAVGMYKIQIILCVLWFYMFYGLNNEFYIAVTFISTVQKGWIYLYEMKK